MTKTKCLIVDDEPIAQRIISRYLAELPEFILVATCANALAAREALQQEDIDLMFLDIEMPKLKGLAFLKTLRQPPQVIITTAHREYALEGFELEVVDYLLKPISFERFLKAVNRVPKKQASSPDPDQTAEPGVLYVKSERKTLKINETDILYLEGMNNYVKIHLREKSNVVYTSLTAMQEKLSAGFLRIHKSFVINRQHIRAYNKEAVEVGGKELPIGKAYKEVIELF